MKNNDNCHKIYIEQRLTNKNKDNALNLGFFPIKNVVFEHVLRCFRC
jgi:hypothetical protein